MSAACHTARSYGAFWMSLAIFNTLTAAGVYGQGSAAAVTKGDRLMLTLWGILVRAGCCLLPPLPGPAL